MEGRPKNWHLVELQWKDKTPVTMPHDQSSRLEKIEVYDLYANHTTFENQLVWGENSQILGHWLKQYKGKVDLIYLDPPFDAGIDFTMTVPIGKSGENIEVPAYEDRWNEGIHTYLQMIYERLFLAKELLAETGSLFLHSDWRVSPYLRIILDEVFEGNLRNEIIWCYTGPGRPGMKQYNRKHDTIYWYSKSPDQFQFYDDQIRVPHQEKTKANFKKGLRGSGFTADTYDLPPGKIPEDWWSIPVAARFPVDGALRTGYATEKPAALLERIIKTATRPGDLVADFFCGSGTTGAIAERLGRRWIMADKGLLAIQTTRQRLLENQRILKGKGDCLPFSVYHLKNEIEKTPAKKDPPKIETDIIKINHQMDIDLIKIGIPHGTDQIQFWGIDFNWRKNAPFHCDWCSYRTRKFPNLTLRSDRNYPVTPDKTQQIRLKIVLVNGSDYFYSLENP